jgi:hypothetical protein
VTAPGADQLEFDPVREKFVRVPAAASVAEVARVVAVAFEPAAMPLLKL